MVQTQTIKASKVGLYLWQGGKRKEQKQEEKNEEHGETYQKHEEAERTERKVHRLA